MLTILTLVGHSEENFERLRAELREVVTDWVLVMDNECQPPPDYRYVRTTEETRLNFGAMRNQGLALVKTPWVFHLDSDEWYSEVQMRALLSILGELDENVDCLMLPRRNVGLTGDWLGWPDTRPVVHRADKGILWEGAVEEWPKPLEKVVMCTTPSSAILHMQLNMEVRQLVAQRRMEISAVLN